MSANLTFNRISYRPVNNVLIFDFSSTGEKISNDSIKIKILVKMDSNKSRPVNGAISCELRHPGLYRFEDGSEKIVIPFNGKTKDFTEEFGKKIIFKNASSTPELPVVVDVSVKDDKYGDIYPEDSEKGRYWWEPVVPIRILNTFI